MKLFLSSAALIGALAPPLLLLHIQSAQGKSNVIFPSSSSSSSRSPRHLSTSQRQEDTAAEISRIASELNDSGIHGIAIPLNYARLNSNQGNEQQLSVALRISGEEDTQNLLIDTGSSSLAFCDSAFAKVASEKYLKTDYAQCNLYGVPNECPDDDDNSKGYHTSWVGSVYKGNVEVFNTINQKEVATLKDVNYAIMDEESFYPCDGPLDGIFGVAFSALNSAFDVSAASFQFSDMLTTLCTNESDQKIVKCNVKGLSSTTLNPPLEQVLKQSVESGEDHSDAFGLYCDYAATMDAKEDQGVVGLGMFVGGDLALENDYYKKGTPLIAKLASSGAWYTLNLQKIRMPTMNLSYDYKDYCDPSTPNCYTDSGTSGIWLPIDKSYCESLLNATTEELEGDLLIDLEGDTDGETITLKFPLMWILEQAVNGRISFTDPEDDSGRFVLGFPTFQHYYIVYDMGKATVTFVDIEQKEYEDTISSGELGALETRVCAGDTYTAGAISNHGVTIISSVLGILLFAFFSF